MRKRFQRAAGEAEVDMTPMLDIVFIMLIFFIAAAVFLDEQGLVLSEAPESPSTEATLPSILVQLDANDSAFIDGARVEIAAVPSRVEALRANKPAASVILQANAGASVDAVVGLKDRFDRASVPMTLKIER